MTEDRDEQLLRQFFSEAAQQQIADDGFTERVMQRIAAVEAHRIVATKQVPIGSFRRFNRLWTVLCVAVFVALFVAFRGWELLAIQLEVMLRVMATQSPNINLLALCAILFGLLFVGVEHAVSRA